VHVTVDRRELVPLPLSIHLTHSRLATAANHNITSQILRQPDEIT